MITVKSIAPLTSETKVYEAAEDLLLVVNGTSPYGSPLPPSPVSSVAHEHGTPDDDTDNDNEDIDDITLVLSAPSTLASIALGTPNTLLSNRVKAFVLVREIKGIKRKGGKGFGWRVMVNVDRTSQLSSPGSPGSTKRSLNFPASPGATNGAKRRMSVNFRSILVQRKQLLEMVNQWKISGFKDLTGVTKLKRTRDSPPTPSASAQPSTSTRAEQISTKFFDGRIVDYEMKAWISTGVPPSRGSMLRWILWRISLDDSPSSEEGGSGSGGLKLYGGVKSGGGEGKFKNFHFDNGSHDTDESDGNNDTITTGGKILTRRGSTASTYTPRLGVFKDGVFEDANAGVNDLFEEVQEVPVNFRPFRKNSYDNNVISDVNDGGGEDGGGCGDGKDDNNTFPINLLPFQPPSPDSPSKTFKNPFPTNDGDDDDGEEKPSTTAAQPNNNKNNTTGNTNHTGPPLAKAFNLEAEKKVVGLFPPRRTSLSIVPEEVKKKTRGRSFVAGGMDLNLSEKSSEKSKSAADVSVKQAALIAAEFVQTTREAHTGNANHVGMPLEKAFNLEAEKKVVGLFPPRRNSLNVVPEQVRKVTGGKGFSVGGLGVAVDGGGDLRKKRALSADGVDSYDGEKGKEDSKVVDFSKLKVITQTQGKTNTYKPRRKSMIQHTDTNGNEIETVLGATLAAQRALLNMAIIRNSGRLPSGNSKISGAPLETAFALEAEKKVVGLFPPRRGSLSVVPDKIRRETGGNGFAVGGMGVVDLEERRRSDISVAEDDENGITSPTPTSMPTPTPPSSQSKNTRARANLDIKSRSVRLSGRDDLLDDVSLSRTGSVEDLFVPKDNDDYEEGGDENGSLNLNFDRIPQNRSDINTDEEEESSTDASSSSSSSDRDHDHDHVRKQPNKPIVNTLPSRLSRPMTAPSTRGRRSDSLSVAIPRNSNMGSRSNPNSNRNSHGNSFNGLTSDSVGGGRIQRSMIHTSDGGRRTTARLSPNTSNTNTNMDTNTNTPSSTSTNSNSYNPFIMTKSRSHQSQSQNQLPQVLTQLQDNITKASTSPFVISKQHAVKQQRMKSNKRFLSNPFGNVVDRERIIGVNFGPEFEGFDREDDDDEYGMRTRTNSGSGRSKNKRGKKWFYDRHGRRHLSSRKNRDREDALINDASINDDVNHENNWLSSRDSNYYTAHLKNLHVRIQGASSKLLAEFGDPRSLLAEYKENGIANENELKNALDVLGVFDLHPSSVTALLQEFGGNVSVGVLINEFIDKKKLKRGLKRSLVYTETYGYVKMRLEKCADVFECFEEFGCGLEEWEVEGLVSLFLKNAEGGTEDGSGRNIEVDLDVEGLVNYLRKECGAKDGNGGGG